MLITLPQIGKYVITSLSEKFPVIHLLIHVEPDCFLGCESQWKINTVEGHPVDMGLPLRPLPEGERVAWRTNILVVPEPIVGRQIEGCRGQ